VTLKILFVDADLLNADYARAGDEFDDPIYEQKRIPMREEFFIPSESRTVCMERSLSVCQFSFVIAVDQTRNA
jgi:hypothetical protein